MFAVQNSTASIKYFDIPGMTGHLRSELDNIRETERELEFVYNVRPGNALFDVKASHQNAAANNYFVDRHAFTTFLFKEGLLGEDVIDIIDNLQPDELPLDDVDNLLLAYIEAARHIANEGTSCTYDEDRSTSETLHYLSKWLRTIRDEIESGEAFQQGNPKPALGLDILKKEMSNIARHNITYKQQFEMGLVAVKAAEQLYALRMESTGDCVAPRLEAANADTGMSRYISVEDPYDEAQLYHLGRPEAREAVVIPILQTIGAKDIVEMGPALGEELTTRALDLGIKVDAVEFDGDYYRGLVQNLGSNELLTPIHGSITDYKPAVPNSKHAFVALGAFSDFSPDKAEWVKLLSNMRENVLTPGAPVILEEEIIANLTGPDARDKGLAIQRGKVMFNALLRGKLGLNEMEVRALLSSLHGMADFKGRLIDFVEVFREAGFNDIQWVKVEPAPHTETVKIDPDDLVINRRNGFWYKPNSGQPSAMDRFNYIVNQLLLIDPSLPNPQLSLHYDMAMSEVDSLNQDISRYKDSADRDRLLKENLGLEITQGQKPPLNRPEDDREGGVYVLIARAA